MCNNQKNNNNKNQRNDNQQRSTHEQGERRDYGHINEREMCIRDRVIRVKASRGFEPREKPVLLA